MNTRVIRAGCFDVCYMVSNNLREPVGSERVGLERRRGCDGRDPGQPICLDAKERRPDRGCAMECRAQRGQAGGTHHHGRTVQRSV